MLRIFNATKFFKRDAIRSFTYCNGSTKNMYPSVGGFEDLMTAKTEPVSFKSSKPSSKVAQDPPEETYCVHFLHHSPPTHVLFSYIDIDLSISISYIYIHKKTIYIKIITTIRKITTIDICSNSTSINMFGPSILHQYHMFGAWMIQNSAPCNHLHGASLCRPPEQSFGPAICLLNWSIFHGFYYIYLKTYNSIILYQ